MAQILELSHLCQMQNSGDRWLNSHSKQVSCAIYVPKNLKMTYFVQSSALVCHNFSSTSSCLFGTDGASPKHGSSGKGPPGPESGRGTQRGSTTGKYNGEHNGETQQKDTTGRLNGKMMENEKCHVYGA